MKAKHKAVFYLITATTTKERDLYVCRVIEKAFTAKHKIYIYTSNPEETQTLDTQLWTFRDISFVPHAIYNGDTNSETPPILIGHITPPSDFDDILVNLTVNIPIFHQQFSHLIEVVPNDENLRAITRKHYKYYQSQNYKTEIHNC